MLLMVLNRDYARASTSRHNGGQEQIDQSEIRPDTPPPAEDEDKEDVVVEFNDEGRLTARSKGKGRAN